jgi:hypothetical protein
MTEIDTGVRIPAGVSLDEFKRLIGLAGGHVYEAAGVAS